MKKEQKIIGNKLLNFYLLKYHNEVLDWNDLHAFEIEISKSSTANKPEI